MRALLAALFDWVEYGIAPPEVGESLANRGGPSGVERWSDPSAFPRHEPGSAPARVRSRIMSTSNSLNTPIIWNKGLAGRRRGVDRLLMEIEVDPGAADLAEETDKVLQRTAQAVDTDGPRPGRTCGGSRRSGGDRSRGGGCGLSSRKYLGRRGGHIDIAAAAVRTHQSLTPVKNACLRAMPLGLFRGSGSN